MAIPNVITVKDVAEATGLSEQRVRALLRSGELEGQQLGKQWLVPESDASEFQRNRMEDISLNRPRSQNPLPAKRVLSFFSGAMGLDLGLEDAGLDVLLACEVDKACRKTIAANRPELALLGDISAYSAEDIRTAAGLGLQDEIDVIVGGPPCQAFSTAGARRGFKDERGNVFLKYIDLITELRPKYAVIENVRGLLSAPLNHRPHSERNSFWTPAMDEKPGGALLYVIDRLREHGYGVSFNLYNSANFGVPQVRERVILICHREGDKVPHLSPTHAQRGEFGLHQWATLRDAINGLSECTHTVFPESRLRFYRMLKDGQYWKHLPTELQKEALGNSYFSGGGKTGFLRRLAWDKPSCTLVTSPTMPATDICHPEADRPLSVQEYKRIQQFPDEWQLCGSISDQYRQIGNAVPVGLGRAVGLAIVNHMNGVSEPLPIGFPFSRYKGTDEVSWERSTRRALQGKEIAMPSATKQFDQVTMFD
jgi:DNA (cytosine-5)-methyltransferase 1